MSAGPKTTLYLERYSTPVSDSQGGASVGWYTVRSITGVLSTLDDREIVLAGKIAGDATHVFTIDYPVGLTLSRKDRFRKYTSEYEITGIKNKENQQRRLRIYLRERI